MPLQRRTYLVIIMRIKYFTVALALALLAPIIQAQAQWAADYAIPTPERVSPRDAAQATEPDWGGGYALPAPDRPPAGKSARAPARQGKKRIGSAGIVVPTPLPPPLHYNPEPVPTVVAPPPAQPPGLYVPQTGQVVPNFPTVTGAGPGGSETFQDRAVRCAGQASAFGPGLTGDRNTYIGGCVNQ